MGKIIGISILVFLIVCVGVIVVARFVHRRQIKIDETEGIQEEGYFKIGGLDQYVQIRGQKRDNALLVLVHGGPGEPFAFLSYAWQLRLEQDYTVVHWNQRQSGRTYFANRKRTFEVSFEALVEDLDELINGLSERFHQPIFLMGHSWGTAIAVEYIARFPEKIAAYVGIGQMIDYEKETEVAYRHAYQLAKAEDDTNYLRELRQHFTVLREKLRRGKHSPRTMANFDAKKAKYLDRQTIQTKLKVLWYSVTSPLLTWRDLRWLLLEGMHRAQYHRIQAPLTKFMMQYHNSHYRFNLPVIWISGDEDYETPYTLVEEYYKRVDAPRKQYIKLHGAGHSAFLENGPLFCDTLIQALRFYQ